MEVNKRNSSFPDGWYRHEIGNLIKTWQNSKEQKTRTLMITCESCPQVAVKNTNDSKTPPFLLLTTETEKVSARIPTYEYINAFFTNQFVNSRVFRLHQYSIIARDIIIIELILVIKFTRHHAVSQIKFIRLYSSNRVHVNRYCVDLLAEFAF